MDLRNQTTTAPVTRPMRLYVLRRDAPKIGLSIFLLLFYIGLNTLLAQFIPIRWASWIMIPFAALSFSPLMKRIHPLFDTRLAHRQVPTRLRIHNTSPKNRRGALTGQTLDGYQLMDMIGKGGMSEVYRAQSGGLLLAVKVIDTQRSPEALMRFEREVQMLQQAKHPNVVQVFDSGALDDYAYMVMEYIEGINLKDYIEHEAPLPMQDVINIVDGIANAADHMHKLGIIHRDLKPGNIMLYWDSNQTCIPLLLDFGVAKQSSVTVITLEGTVGTIEYMSPEQILEAPLVQPSSDVYAIGVMVYEMLTGQLPYDGSIGAIVFGHLHGDERNPADVNENIPPYMAQAVCRAMSKDPKDRFPNLTTFAAALAARDSH